MGQEERGEPLDRVALCAHHRDTPSPNGARDPALVRAALQPGGLALQARRRVGLDLPAVVLPWCALLRPFSPPGHVLSGW